jgi:hypothetical protein
MKYRDLETTTDADDRAAAHEPIRVLYAREHATVWPGLGVFLAGPTPPEPRMASGWRRVLIDRLLVDLRLDPTMVVVAPEPRDGSWQGIEVRTGRPGYDEVINKQIPWEWQYLTLCDVTVFWLATYWQDEDGGPFPGNIGPTTRWEFGYYLQEYLKNPRRRTLIVGAPEDAQNVNWARRVAEANRIAWHELAVNEKGRLIPDSLVEAIVRALLQHQQASAK